MPDIESDDRSRFSTPEAVVAARALSRARKVELLRNWEFDQHEIAVAQGEGMDGPEPDLLGRIKRALAELGEDPELPSARRD